MVTAPVVSVSAKRRWLPTRNTAAVAAESAREARIPVVYLREASQGNSFALNRGLAHTTTDIIALTDDDVLPAPGWLNRIVAAFRDRDVTFVCGKVLPLWSTPPPPELLTPRGRDIWGPLAIVDYGDTPIEYVAPRFDQLLPIGANVAFYSLRDFSQNFAWGPDARPMLNLCGLLFLIGVGLVAGATRFESLNRWVASSRISGAGGYICFPMGVSPLPSFEWQPAQ